MSPKLLSFFFLLVFGGYGALGQTRSCGTMDNVKRLERERPNLRMQLQQQARTAGSGFKNPLEKRALGGVVTIPVVVHVLYNTSTQNISDAQIASQIAVLNKDFRRLNADANSTPAAFKGLAADAEIEFCLAQRTPTGEPTTGITRTSTTVTDFKSNEAMKFKSSGGQDAWNTKEYLNIWVVRFAAEEDLLGYAQFPNSGSAATDGVVVDYRAFGTSGTAMRPFNQGRTATHEVGHWLNLFHIWGDEDCGDDKVDDTPTQEAENVGCPTFPSPSCSTGSDMFVNYMDYTNDACMNLFTTGQKNVMQGVLSLYRPGLLTSKGCRAVQVPELDAGLLEVTSPGHVVCATSISPVVVLRNTGSQTLTTAQVRYQVDNGPAQTFTWTGSLATFQNATVALPTVNITAGKHTVNFKITSRNNATTDGDASNDAISTSVQAFGTALPLQEGFEATAFPPVDWRIQNPNEDLTWERSTLAAKTGTASAVMRNFHYPANGLADELVLPPLDLTSRTKPKLTFQLAYSLLSSSGFSDTLEVWASMDCGTSYKRVYQKFDRELTTATPAFTEEDYVPTAVHWRLETVDLAQFASAKTVLIKFRHVTDFENNLYIDDVKVDGEPLGAEDKRAQQAVQVAPNPTTGHFTITSPEATVSSIQVCDAVGKVLQVISTARHTRNQSIQVSLQDQANGLYLVRIMTDKGVVVRRVMLLK